MGPVGLYRLVARSDSELTTLTHLQAVSRVFGVAFDSGFRNGGVTDSLSLFTS